jgi:predicted anti-sigma-YlaC factor YlaD
MAMTDCQKWKDALIDHALGQSADTALEGHLAACPACADALRGWRERAAQLDPAIRQITAVEPGPFGPERILSRAALRPRRSFYVRLAWALPIVILVALTFYKLSRPEPRAPLPLTALSTWRSPTQSLLRSPADPLLKDVPRLGEGFFQMKSQGVKNAQ